MAKGMIIGAAVTGVLLIGAISVYGYASSLQKAGVEQEQALDAQYQADQLVLDTGVKQIVESASIANLKTDKLDKILSDAVRGRYDGNGSSAQVGRGQLFSSIQEAYPNIDVSVYDRIIDQEMAFRQNFLATQTKFRDEIRVYETWRNEGLIQPALIRMMGFPSQNLEARIGTQTWHGQAALDQMKVLVTSGDTDTAFQTGHEDPIQIPGAAK